MKLRNFRFKTVSSMIRSVFFFILNHHKYKKLALGAFIDSPLRLDGCRYMTISKNVIIQKHSWLFARSFDAHDPELIFGEGCIIGNFNHICAVKKVVFGKNVLTADKVYISDNGHGFDDINIPIMHQLVKFKSEVFIGDGSWIGENVCIIGAKIGRNCVVGANSVVTKDIPDYCVVAGVPAKVIKKFNINTNQWERVQVNT